MAREASQRRSLGSGPAPVGHVPYQVGYGRPPTHTRFQKGRSGNPRGRPRGARRREVPDAGRLALLEAYRPVSVREGDKVIKMPALQAVMRSMVAQAAKGSTPAGRELLKLVMAAESQALARKAEQQDGQGPDGAPPGTDSPPGEGPVMSNAEASRRLLFHIHRAISG